MNTDVNIRMATNDDAALVGQAVTQLIHELFPESIPAYPEEKMIDAARTLLVEDSGVWAFIASNKSGETVGVLTLNECAAISAGGSFGEIYELYVSPDARSANVGWELIKASAEFGKSRSWPMLEVGAPDLPRWKRTYKFYLKHGFTEIGPRLELRL